METDVKHIISVQDLLLWGNKNEEFCKEAGKKHPKIKLLRHIDKRTKVIDGTSIVKNRNCLRTIKTSNAPHGSKMWNILYRFLERKE